MGKSIISDDTYDVIIIGSGASGMAAAITAKKDGLQPIILEKAQYYGGTTAFSGGVLWIPGNHYYADKGVTDTRQAAEKYLKHETGKFFNREKVAAYLENGPKMLDFMTKHTDVQFVPTLYPDYHPEAPGGVELGRSIVAAPFDGRELGGEFQRLRPPLKTITFMGMMFNSSNNDLKHFFNVTRSITSALYVAKRLGIHLTHLLRYRRGVSLTAGNALAARLAKSVFNLSIPLITNAPVRMLTKNADGVEGVIADIDGEEKRLHARYGVILAAGGFARDSKRIAKVYPHVKRNGTHFTPVPESNTGDGIAMGEAVGGIFSWDYGDAAAWMPVSKVKTGRNEFTAFPHLVDRYKPGFIMVTPKGKRFVNEAASYHDVGQAMIAACGNGEETSAWLIADHKTIRKYGIGHVKPAPVPLFSALRSGYLVKGRSLAELAAKMGMDAAALKATVEAFNVDAERGEDSAFGRGESAFNRYLGDADHHPNPCVAPIKNAPFYAVKILMGDLGTFSGLMTDSRCQVLDESNMPIHGLYAVGNDSASVMGGAYPGGGITLGPALTFGFIAANEIAAKARKNVPLHQS